MLIVGGLCSPGTHRSLGDASLSVIKESNRPAADVYKEMGTAEAGTLWWGDIDAKVASTVGGALTIARREPNAKQFPILPDSQSTNTIGADPRGCKAQFSFFIEDARK